MTEHGAALLETLQGALTEELHARGIDATGRNRKRLVNEILESEGKNLTPAMQRAWNVMQTTKPNEEII